MPRMQVAYFGPAAMPSSSKSTVLPSRERSRALDQLSHERSRSRDSPAVRPTILTRAVSSVISTRPARETSWIRKPSGRRASRRSRPERLTAYKEEFVPPPVRRREPDLLAIGRPREPLDPWPLLRERALAPGEIHHGHRAAVVHLERMVEEGDSVRFGGEAGEADVSDRFVEHFSEGKFQSPASADVAGDDQACPVRRPIRLLRVLRDGTGGAAGDRGPRAGFCPRPAPSRCTGPSRFPSCRES